MSTSTPLTQTARDAFNKTLGTVEEVHQSIAEWPFDLADRVGVLPEAAAEGKRVTSETIASVYDVIRNVNEKVSDYADNLLGQSAS